jgi:hypothetical protein
MVAAPDTREPGDMALRRQTRVFRIVGWLVCQVIGIPSIDDVDQAALDTHIAALAERDAEGRVFAPEPGPEPRAVA